LKSFASASPKKKKSGAPGDTPQKKKTNPEKVKSRILDININGFHPKLNSCA